MPALRCEFCVERPREETAVMKWRGEERQRLTIQLCAKHHARIAKAGDRGWDHKDYKWKLGFW